MTIWKFELEHKTSQIINMPSGAKIISAKLQGNKLCIWAIVNLEHNNVGRIIYVYGTGHPMLYKTGNFIDTVIQDVFVWHVFEG